MTENLIRTKNFKNNLLIYGEHTHPIITFYNYFNPNFKIDSTLHLEQSVTPEDGAIVLKYTWKNFHNNCCMWLKHTIMKPETQIYAPYNPCIQRCVALIFWTLPWHLYLPNMFLWAIQGIQHSYQSYNKYIHTHKCAYMHTHLPMCTHPHGLHYIWCMHALSTVISQNLINRKAI